MFSSLIDWVDSTIDMINGQLKYGISNYCDLATADDKHVLVAQGGALLSIVRIEGMRQMVSNRTLYHQVVSPIRGALQSLFESKAHQIQVWFEVDHDRTPEEVSAILAPSRETANRLGMDMDDLLDEREATMIERTASERCFVVLWTLPTALTKSEAKTEKQRRKKEEEGRVRGGHESQNPLSANSMLRNRHISFVDAFCRELDTVSVVTSRLKVHEALREVRRSIDPGFTGPDWQPSLPGDKVVPSIRRNRVAKDEWDILWPPLSWQVCPREATIVEANAVEIGDRVYAPIYLNLFPRSPEFFPFLFDRTLSKRLPWRISFLMEGSGLSGFRFKALLAGLVSFADSGNKMMNRAYKELEAAQSENHVIVQGRVSLATWAPKGDMDLLHLRLSDLARCVESWGSCHVSEVTGDPMAGVASSALAFTQGSIGTKVAAPMDDFLGMMPWSRPSSPWATGAVTWCSPDGKIMPYQPYSKLQVSWINLIFARPGSGKSVLMNMMNFALCLGSGQTRLPRIAIIDVGPSSSGLISLLREALPPSRRHEVAHKRLRMTESHAINPFDTQLGCRIPTSLETQFLRNLVTLLVTDFDKEVPSPGMPGLVSEVIKEMYLSRSDRGTPNAYTPAILPKVDEALANLNASLDRNTTWWEVVDLLFSAGEHYLAKQAQRYAVPLLADAVSAAMGERIGSTYGDIRVEGTGELLVTAFSRMIAEALQFYPILARPTAFDAGDASIMAIDLDEVAKSGGAVGDRVTGVMYMLARQILAKDYYINVDSVSEMPAPDNVDLRPSVPREAYKEYHTARLTELKHIPKRICYDEFHRTSRSEAVRRQVLMDMREGRKYLVDVMLASQTLGDFDKEMIEFATGIFIMDGGNETMVKEIADKFGFSDPSERVALESKVRAPSQGRPGIFMGKFITNLGNYSLLLSAPLGPISLWAFSTTAEDVAIRNRLYEILGPSRARRALALAYPRGSAKGDIEERRDSMKERVGILDNATSGGVIDQVIKEVEALAERMSL